MADPHEEMEESILQWSFKACRLAMQSHEERMGEACMLEGQPPPRPPAELIQLLKNTHAMLIASKKSRLPASNDFARMSPQEKLLALESARAEVLNELDKPSN